MRRRSIAGLIVTGAVVALLIWNAVRDRTLTPLQVAALLRTDPLRALDAAESALKVAPSDSAMLQVAVNAAQSARLPERGLQIIASSEVPIARKLEHLNSLARFSQQTGRLEVLESAFQLILESTPSDATVRREYATLLLSECRRFESLPQLFQLVSKDRSFLLDELVMLGSWEELLDDPDLLNSASTDSASGLIVPVARAKIKAYSGDHAAAIAMLKSKKIDAVADSATVEWHAALGRSLVAIGDIAGLDDWARQAMTAAGRHPDVDYSLGWLASQKGRLQDAAQHLASAIKLLPEHRQAQQLLGTLLAADGQSDSGQLLLERARQLDEVERLLHRILQNDRSRDQLLKAVELMEQLGRSTEAWAWLTAAQGLHPRDAAAIKGRTDALLQKSMSELTQTDAAIRAQLASVCDNVRLTTPVAPGASAVDVTRRLTPANSGAADIRFEDISQTVGLSEPYYGGLPEDCRGLTIFQGFGGGVAVLDADADSAPDLYFVHGNTWPISDDARSCDRFYRRGATAYSDISAVAVPPDREYGQGVATGDFDNDGFDDLYVAAIGSNRLLLNNGDGTFSLADAAQAALTSLLDWTTSCAIVDLTGDQIPDLLDINYSNSADVFTKVCLSGSQQLQRSCRPDLFVGAPDRLLIGSGGGEVALQDDVRTFPIDVGRGMGVVIGDFEERGLLDAFVSNDMTPNALLKAVPDDNGQRAFSDEALLRGAATNGAGRIQAGMGIAADDLTGDGRTDFFVTNFLEETNTLYQQTDGGFYTDASARSGADEGSLDMLTFGTQPIDADVDGDADIVLVNGHVDDFTHMDAPWKMPPAAYNNAGSGAFQRWPASVLGTYGETAQLGRAMARLDWNNDGRDDLVVTHLDRSPALLQNDSVTAGEAVRLRLSGTKSCRTPFGAIVRAELTTNAGGTRTAVRQLLAGDGYYCANEHQISFAVRHDEVVTSLTITWPSGTRQRLTSPTTPGLYRVVESRDRLFELPDSP